MRPRWRVLKSLRRKSHQRKLPNRRRFRAFGVISQRTVTRFSSGVPHVTTITWLFAWPNPTISGCPPATIPVRTSSCATRRVKKFRSAQSSKPLSSPAASVRRVRTQKSVSTTPNANSYRNPKAPRLDLCACLASAQSPSNRRKAFRGYNPENPVNLVNPVNYLDRIFRIIRINKMTMKSEELFSIAQNLIPGGVNSPVRAFRGVGGIPRFISSARGATITDVDGRTYIDYVGSWGPMILGHADEEVVAAVQEVAAKGTSFGAPTELEINLAHEVIDAVPSIEMVRMVSSGTEATMSAIRLARGVTGRTKLVKFEGCYHGHADSLLVKAGSGVATLGLPDSP